MPSIFDQIKNDPLIAAKYLGWIKDKTGRTIPFFPNQVQQRYRNTKLLTINSGKPARFLVLKSRRMGLTTQEQFENLHLCKFRPNQSVLTIAHDAESTQLIFNIAKFFYEKLPAYLKTGETKLNKREIKFPDTNSQFYIGTAGTPTFGRGQTLQKIHCSEVAFWPGSNDDIDNLIVGLSEACSHGEMVLETTANGRDNWFYNIWSGAKAGTNSWTPIFFPWYEDQSYQVNSLSPDEIKELQTTLDTEELELIGQYSLSFKQIQWRRNKIKELRSKRKFDQEYPKNDIVAFLASGSCFFDVEMIQGLIDQCDQPLSRDQCIKANLFLHNEDITYWSLPDRNKKYIAGTDTAGGAINEKSNYCVTSISEKDTLRQVARFRTKLNPTDFARINCNSFLPQFNNPRWAIEENNHGGTVISIAYNECNYTNFYRMTDPITGQQKRIGFNTNVRTRPLLLNTLNDFLWDCYREFKASGTRGIINDTLFLDECLNFTDNNGKYEASSGCFDDTIFPNGLILQASMQPECAIDFV